MRACSNCGVVNPGHARFCLACGTQLAAADPHRRLVTALFCDLVGSTEIGEHLDAESLRKLLQRFFKAMRGAIERHGGTVEKFIGDAVVGSYGAAAAHEDDALRAVRSALDMQDAAAALDEQSVPIRIRIAVHSGEVFVDGTEAMQGAIGGDVFSTAARLQAAADPGSVIASAAVERMLRGHLDLDPLGPVALKGKADPVTAFRVLGIRPVPARAETPLIGRDRHLRMLSDALEDAVDSQACVLIIVLAPPGVGKSRLAAAFADAVRERARVLIGQTPSYGEGVTFAPLAELLAQAVDRPVGNAAVVAEALHVRLAAELDGRSVGNRLAQVLGVGEALGSDAAWAVRRLLEVLASERPLVVVLEDVHWAEPPMLDLVAAVVERVHGPVLVLCLARPELLEQRPTWAAGKPRALTMTLPPLSAGEARQVAELLLGSQTPATIVDRVCRTAEGNPLFLEQLVAMLADQGLIEEGCWVGSDDVAVEIPPTLRALLAARLDGLDSAARLVLERASVEGRRFRTSALRVLADELRPEELDSRITELDRRGLVQPESEAGGRWRFSHALVLEATYRGVSKELRADLHERLADWLSCEDADLPDVDESVARHLERAVHLREELGARDERTDAISARAGKLFAAAGTRAFAALDHITADDLLERALALLPAASPRRLDLLPNLAVALMETGRADEAERLLSEGVEVARAAGSERDALRARVQLLNNRIFRSPTDAEVESAAAEARDAFRLFESANDDVGSAEAALALAWLGYAGESRAEVHAWTRNALRHALAAGRLREMSEAAANLLTSACEGPMPFGDFGEAAEELSALSVDPICETTAHALRTVAALASGDEAEARAHERRFREVVERNGLTGLGAEHSLSIAETETWAGAPEAAVRRLWEAREILEPLGDIWWVSAADCALCSAVWAQERPREFLRQADALEISAFVADRAISIRRQSTRARAQLLRGRAHEAELSARRGVEAAEESDLLQEHAQALLALSEVLDARGLEADSSAARREAIAKLEAKGNLAAVARLRG